MIAGTMSGLSELSGVVEDTTGGSVIRVRVRPRSSRRGVLGVTAGALVIGVGAAPEKGRATDEAVRALAARLDVAPSRVAVISGATSRSKRISVAGMSAADVRARLAPPPGSDPS
jgi:uncharacterized protein